MSAPASSIPALWLLACLLCTVGGIFIGHQTHTPVATAASASPATTHTHPSATALAQPTATADQLDASPPSSPTDRRAELTALLQRFGNEPDWEFDSFTKLAAWLGTADQRELADTLILAKSSLSNEYAGVLLYQFVFTRWASLDGPAALKAGLAQTKNRAVLDPIFKSWIRNGDAQAAIDHAIALQRSDPDVPPLIDELLVVWHKQDPVAATSRARELAVSENVIERAAARQVAADAARHTLDTEGVDAALNFISAWPDQETHDKLLISLLTDWHSGTDRDLDTVARILSRVRDASVASPDALAPLASSIDHLLSSDSTAEARRWCASLPPTFQPLAVNQIAQKLAERDQWREALAWLQAHPAPPKTYATAYNKVASAAAKGGEMSEALRLPGQMEPRSVFHDGRANLLQDWIDGDPTRADLLLDFIVAAESAEAPGSASP